MTAPSDPRTHLPALDGLRGVAALIVVISHVANAGMLPAVLGQGFGRLGVALFFGLSGLLMARLYLHRPFDRANITDYATRRGARVLPLYYAAIVLGVAMLGMGLSPYEQEGPGDVLLAAGLLHGTGVLWSIPVELQFYVVFALVWLCASRGHLAGALVALVALQALAVALIMATEGFGPRMENTYNLAFWSHFFVVGTVLGVLSTRARAMASFGARGPVVTVATGALIAAVLLAPPAIRADLGLPRAPAFADPLGAGYMLALLVAGLLDLGVMRVFATRPLRWLGRISFSVYLLHMPVLVAVLAALPGVAPAVQAALVIGGTLAVSTLSERWIEMGAQRAILRRTLHAKRPSTAA